MKLKLFYLSIILVFLTISLISASSYSVEYTQVNDKIVVKEKIDGKSLESYVDSSLIDKSGDTFYFVDKIEFNQSFNEAKVKINLDTGVIIKDNLIFPSGYKIETDGQIISIVWDINNIAKGEDFAIFITMQDTKSPLNWIYWVAGIIVLIVGFLAYFKFGKKQKTKIVKSKQKNNSRKENRVDYDYLLDTEKKVIEELKKADRNELWQRQIQNSTGFSKAKVSRLVRNLEARNLVVKIPFGNTNKVRLK